MLNMARRTLIFFVSFVALISAQFPTYEQAAIELPAAEISFGNLSSDAIYGQEHTLSLLGRQTCAAGYGICGKSGLHHVTFEKWSVDIV